MAQIIGTIGPASCSPEIIRKMIGAGLSIARFNFAHGSLDEHKETIKIIRKVAKSMGKYIPILTDLCGPKIRLKEIDGIIQLQVGQTFTLTNNNILGNNTKATCTFDLTKCVKKDDDIYINDGFILMKVKQVKNDGVVCIVKIGGNISSGKGINVPGIDLKTDVFTDYDRRCFEFCKEMNIEIVAQSFVETADDIIKIKSFGDVLNYHPIIFAKIERSTAIDNIDNILKVVDGIMVARGDAAVETPLLQIALLQKILIKKARDVGKAAIVATQLAESMIINPKPSRSEVSDITNAVIDGCSYLMLAQETAVGAHPYLTVKAVAEIVNSTMYFLIREWI